MLRKVVRIRPKLIVLVGVVLLMSAAGCATPAPLLPSVSPSAPSANMSPSPTGIARSSTPASPTPTLAAVVPWNPAGVRSVTEIMPAAQSIPAPTNLPGCDGAKFRLLPTSARTAPILQEWSTTFVLAFTGSSPCSTNRGFFGVTMTAADGSTLPIDTMPAGPAHPLLVIRPHQLVFGSITWAVNQGRRHPTHLTFDIGDTPSPQPIDIPVADVSIPPHPTSPSPRNTGGSTAYGLLTFAADPGVLATLTVAVTAPATVRASSTLLYAVTLTNPTNTTVPLTGCPQFVEQLSVVPLKTPTTVGARGPLNCAHLPPTITANTSVTMQMQLDTAGQVPGPGGLTWQLLDHGHEATAGTTLVTVQRN